MAHSLTVHFTRARQWLSLVVCLGFVVVILFGTSRIVTSLADQTGKPTENLEYPKPLNEWEKFDREPPEKKNWIKAAVAIQNGRVKELEELLRSDPGLATRPVDTTVLTTLLHHACIYDQTDSIKILLKHGADTSAKAGWVPETPLHVAARCDSINAVKLLLDEGVDINILGAGPTAGNASPNLPNIPNIPIPFASPLDFAAAAGSERVVPLLLERGAKVDVNPATSRYNALHRAMEGRYHVLGYGNLKRIEDPKTKAAFGNRKVIELLLKHGCDLTDLDFFGNTPFHIAVRRGAYESVDYLLTSHAEDVDVNAPGQFGYTPLQLSVSEFRADGENDVKTVIELLLKHGADRNKLGGPANSQTTAFELAVEQGITIQQKWSEPILSLLRP